MDESQQKPDDLFAPDAAPDEVPNAVRPVPRRGEWPEEARAVGEPGKAKSTRGGDSMTAEDMPWSLDELETDPARPPLDMSHAGQSGAPLARSVRRKAAPLFDVPRETKSTWPPRRRVPRLMGHLAAVILGGMLGLAIGYWLLNRLSGSRFDMPGPAMPGVSRAHSHTQPSDRVDDGTGAGDLHTVPNFKRPIVPDDRETRPHDPAAPADRNAPLTRLPPVESKPLEGTRLPLPEGYVGPRNFTPYRFEDLTEALAAAAAVAGCANCNGTGFVTEIARSDSAGLEGHRAVEQPRQRVLCKRCEGHPAAAITAAVYERFCRLAEVATSVQVDPADADLGDTKDALRLVLLRSAEAQRNLDTIGRLAGRRLESASGDNDGILLAGTVHETTREGQLHLVRIVLFGQPRVVTVASSRRSILGPRDRVIILGTVVRRPRENLIGYRGRLPVVVWGGMPVRLPPNWR